MAQKTDKSPDPNEVLAIIGVKTARRIAAVSMTGFLGAFVLYIAASHPPAVLGFAVFLVLFGLGALWLAWITWNSTARVLELTRTELREAGEGGRVLCMMDNVVRVDRGMFAFKPAGGFLVRLKSAPGRVVAPGLWWRLGRTLGRWRRHGTLSR